MPNAQLLRATTGRAFATLVRSPAHVLRAGLLVAVLAVVGVPLAAQTPPGAPPSAPPGAQQAVLVTGASSGIGRRITETLAARGCGIL